MPIDDAFWVALPHELSSLPLQELFNRVFPPDPSLRQPFLERLDVNGNPDLPDMYDSLVDIFAFTQLGLCTVETHVNHGPKLHDSEVVRNHLADTAAPPLLDLVLEQRFSAIDYAVRCGDFTDRDGALDWMRSRVLLYFLGELDYVLPTEPHDETDAALLPTAQTLVEDGLIERPAGSSSFEVNDLGTEALQEMSALVENVIERYEVFADVLYDPESGDCEFDLGIGVDLRIPVYEAESISPVRAVFLVELNDGEFYRMADDWRTAILDGDFLEALLLPVVERPLVDAVHLDAIIDAGFEFMEDRARESSHADEDAQLRRSIDSH